MTNESYRYYQNLDDQIDLKEIFKIFWNKKIFILAITSVAAIISVLFSLSLPNVYTAKTLLAPTNSQDSLSSKLSSLSAISSIAGVSLPTNSATQSNEALERIKSFNFFYNNFLPNIKLENIMAVKSWQPEENYLIYNDKLFNQKSNEWSGKNENPKQNIPTPQQAYSIYQNIISIDQDKLTSFITISIRHKSPYVAKKWIDIIVHQINETMRKIDQNKAQKSILFLNETAQSSNIKSIKEATLKLVENQMQTLVLVASSEAYIFKTIDSPLVPEQKSGPNRTLICILGTLIGGLASLFYVLVRHYLKKENKI
jgi:LPS O-antigen subunit length determinant protein (WzzB/FepE family)